MAAAAHHARGAPATGWGRARTATSARLRVGGELESRTHAGVTSRSLRRSPAPVQPTVHQLSTRPHGAVGEVSVACVSGALRGESPRTREGRNWRSYFKFRDCRHCPTSIICANCRRAVRPSMGGTDGTSVVGHQSRSRSDFRTAHCLASRPTGLRGPVRWAHCPLCRQPIRSKDKTQTDRPTQTVAIQKPARP